MVAAGKASTALQMMICPSSLPEASNAPSPRQLSEVMVSF